MNPAHEPTDEQREMVEAMVAYGIPQEDIAKVVGIDPKTLRLHYRDEIDTGATKAIALVAGKLFKTATGDPGPQATTSQIFFLKTRAGWKETQVNEHTGKDGTPLAPTLIYEAPSGAPAAAELVDGDAEAQGGAAE